MWAEWKGVKRQVELQDYIDVEKEEEIPDNITNDNNNSNNEENQPEGDAHEAPATREVKNLCFENETKVAGGTRSETRDL